MNCTQQIRALLREHSDGMTLEQIVWAVKRDKANVKKWCVVVPPEDCPKPESVDDMAISAVSKPKRQRYESAQVQP